MAAKSWFQKKLESFKDDFDYRLESLIYNITEKISIRIKQKGITRSQFAGLLKVSSPAITKLLNGNNNFTVKTLLSIADALEFNLKIDFEEKKASACSHSIIATEIDSVYYFDTKAYSIKPVKKAFSDALDSVPHHNLEVVQEDMAA